MRRTKRFKLHAQSSTACRADEHESPPTLGADGLGLERRDVDLQPGIGGAHVRLRCTKLVTNDVRARFSNAAPLAGFAADGISTVNLLDQAGNVIASAPVSDNVYADANPPAGGAAVEALDSHDDVIYERAFDEAP